MITISKYSSTIEYKLKTTLDSSGLTKLQSEIKKVQTELRNMTTYSTSVQLNKPVKEAIKDLDKLQTAIARSYNSKLGMLDTTKLKSNFKDLNLNLSSLQRSFNATGATGQIAFNNLLGRLGNLDTGLKTISKTTDKVMNTLGNTFRWGIIASGFQSIMNSAHEAVQYVKDLDTSLTNIMMVTDYSKQQMNEYAKSANEAAKALGSTTVAMTDATLVFAQQGFDLNKSDQLAQLSTKLANASQQDTATTSDQITAYMNAYGLDSNIEKLSSALDSWAEVANVSAADVQELAAASQKAASTANTVGVNMDQLAAQIATIESVTREAPENIGNGLKTIYARFSDIAMGETLDDGVDLGKVTGTLEKVGVSVLGSDGKMREVGSIMEDLMKVWSNIDSTQKNAIATTLAGKYQLARFEALMNRSDMYNEYKSASQNADGTLDVMNDKYVNSLTGRMNKLQATFEETLGKFFETDDFYGFIDGLTTAVDLMNQLVDAIGGGKNALLGLGAVAGKVFSTSIGRGINNFMSNRQAEKIAKQNAKNAPTLLKDMGLDVSQPRNDDIVNFVQTGLRQQPKMSEEQAKTFNDQKDQLVASRNERIAAETALQEAIIKTNVAYGEEELIVSKVDEETGKMTVNASKLYAQIAEGAGYSVQDVEKMRGSFAKIDNELEKMKQALGLYIEEYIEMPPAIGEASNASKLFTVRTNEILRVVDRLPESTKDTFKNLISQIKEAEADETKFMELLSQLEQKINETQKAINKGTFLETGTDIDAAISRMTNAEAADEMASGNAEETLNSITSEQRIQNLTNMAMAVGNLAYAIESLKSLGSIWDNDDLEIGEKILQTIVTVGMAIGPLTFGIKDLGTGFQTLGQMVLDYGKKRLAAKAATEAATVAEGAAAAASTAGAAALTGEAIAADTATVATKGFFATLLAGLGPILAIVAAVAGIGIVIKLIIDKYNEAANAAKEAQDQADQLADAYNNVKTSHQELEQSFDSYEKAKQAMSELTEGTNEWNSKLKETNNQVLELLDKYPELAKYVHRDSNGVLTFDESGKEIIEQKSQNSVDNAQVAAITSQVNANMAKQRADEVSLERKIGYFDTSLSRGLLNSNIQLSDTQLQQLYSLANKEGEQSLYDPKKVAEAIGSYIINPINGGKYANEDDKLVQEIVNQADKVIDVYTKGKTQSEADSIKMQQVMLSQLQGQKGFDNLDAGTASNLAAILSRAGYSSSGKYQEALEEIKTDDYSTRVGNYANAMGYKIKESDESKTTFLDSNGEPVTIDQSAIDQYLASVKAMSDAATTWQSVATQLEQIANNSQLTEILGEEKTSSMLANFSSENQNIDLSGINETDQRDLYENKKKLTAEELGVTEKFATDAGFIAEDGKTAAENFAEAFSSQLQQQLKEKFNFDEVLSESMESSGPNNFDDGRLQEDIINAVSNIEQLNTAYDKGALSQQDYTKGLIRVGKNIKGLDSEVSSVKDAQKAYNDAISKYGKDSEEAIDASKDLASAQGKLKSAIVMKQWVQAKQKMLKYIDTLQSADKNSVEYKNTVQDMTDVLSDLTGINMSGIDMSNFFGDPQNLEDIKSALDGDYEAYMRVRVAASKEVAAKFKVELEDNNFWDPLQQIQQYALSGEFATLEAGAYLNGQPFFDVLSELISSAIAAGKDVSGVMSSLEAMGIEAEVTYVDKPGIIYDLPDTESAIGGLPHGTQGTIKVPVVKFKKTNPSQSSYENTFRGANTAGSGGSGGSGGGGGGGGDSEYEPKTKDRNEDELDRYKKVDAQLNKIDKTLDKLNTDKERLVGYKWQNAMTKEIKLLYKQIDLQKEKLELQKQEAEEKRNQLANDYGITFDADGIPQNYKEKFQELQNSLNEAIDAYNAETTEEGQEQWEKEIERRQKAFDDFKDLIDKYLDVQIDGIEESEKNIQDFYDKIEDMRIEAFNKQIESVKTIKDINDAWIEFQQIGKGRSDDVFRVGDENVMKLANAWQLSNENMDEYYDNLIAREQKRWHETDDEQEKANAHARAERLRELKANALAGKYDGRNGSGLVDAYIERGSTLSDQIKQMEETGTSSIYGENSKQLYEDAEEFVKDYVSYVKDIEQAQEAVFQSIMDGIDQINDWMNERLDQYDNIIQRLDHQANLVEALRGEESYDELNNIYQAQNANYDAQMTEVKQNIATWEKLKETLEEGSDQWKEVNNKIVESQQKLDELVESSIENLQKIYENTVKKSLKTWTSNLFGQSDMDWVADQWELINRNADYYLDDTNKAYNIQKLQSKYLDLLDDANSSGLATQKKITDQMNEQLGYLRNKTKLSQYDVEYANAKLEILQKQIALEDAQRNKSQMKLRRDSQGNYSYVYTANEDNVRDAENDLLDSTNNMYNLSKDTGKQAMSDGLSAVQEFNSKILEIATNTNLSIEEKQKRIKFLSDNLKEYINGISEQLSTSQKNMLNDFVDMTLLLTDENKSGLDDIAEQIKNGNDEAFSAIDSRWNSSFTKWLTDSDNFEKAQKQLLLDFNNAMTDWQVNVNKIATKVGEDFNNVSTTVNQCTDATNELAKSTEAFYQKCDEGAKKIGGWQDELTNYQKMLANLKDETSKAYQTIEKLTNQIKELETKNANQAAEIEYMKYGRSSSSSGSGGEGDSVDPSSYRAGDLIGYTGKYYNDSYGEDPVGNWYSGEQGAVRISSFSGEPYGHPEGEVGEYSVHIETPNGGHLGWIRPDQMFDTGGYTGDWDNGINEAKNGKLAFLHQKELVLNETDTANILNAVNMIRAMTDGLKSGALSSALSSINSFSGMNSQSSQDLEQNIHIDANFPNVKDASEIEQAILSLADQATQYIHKIR